MPTDNTPDFARGYEYARKVYGRLMASANAQEILEMAEALSSMRGDNAELARGMAAYCRELAYRREE
jgi:hypothetical protein